MGWLGMKTSEQIVNEIVNQEDIQLNHRSDIPKGGMNDFLSGLVKRFYEKQVENFPDVCEECRVVNIQHMKKMADIGYKTPTRMVGGKVYEGSSGWSKDLSFKHKWIISNQLSNFMRNMIYKDFWDDRNAKVRDKFMKDVVKGVDSYELLRVLRMYYGTNPNPVIKE